jgi:thiamine kinase-like enzyme
MSGMDLLANPVFQRAVADIEALGFCVSSGATPDSRQYAIIGARSNLRWWLIPLETGDLAASGLALFQPLLRAAAIAKAGAAALARIRMHRMWVRRRIHLEGDWQIGQYFSGAGPLAFAFFTGTHSPHRKLAVQVMDRGGNILGFAKVTRNPVVKRLLIHEATSLRRIQQLELATAAIPNVLFAGEWGNSYTLITDTLKTTRSRTSTRLTPAHRAFLEELVVKGPTAPRRTANEIAADQAERLRDREALLTCEWQTRMRAAINQLASAGDIELDMVLSHGDFTASNTFSIGSKLYVFDWEYSRQAPAGYDLIHFALGGSSSARGDTAAKVRHIIEALAEPWVRVQLGARIPTLLAYVIEQVLFQLERLTAGCDMTWDRQSEFRDLLDALAR